MKNLVNIGGSQILIIFFENTTEIYIEIKIRRMLALKDMSIYGVCNSTFAYYKINPAGIKFLEILSTCNSLEELELKLAIFKIDKIKLYLKMLNVHNIFYYILT